MDDKKQSFEFYYTKYYSQVYGYILKKIGNPEQSEDITMDIFFSCYRKFEMFDINKASFATWLYTITNNKLKNYYRDRKTGEELDESLPSQENFEDDILRAANITYLRNELAVALDKLSELQRKIVIYKFFGEKNAVEISELVGVSHTNVRVNLSRALKKLKGYFDEKNIKWED